MHFIFAATSWKEELEKFEQWMKEQKLEVPEEYCEKFRQDFGGIPGNLNLTDEKQIREIVKRCPKGDHTHCDHHTNVLVNEVKLYQIRFSNTGQDEFMSKILPYMSMGHFDKKKPMYKKIMDFIIRMFKMKPFEKKKEWENGKDIPGFDSLYIFPIAIIEDEKTKHGIDKV